MFGRVTTEDAEGLGGLLVTDGHQTTRTRADGSFELTTPEGELIMVASRVPARRRTCSSRPRTRSSSWSCRASRHCRAS